MIKSWLTMSEDELKMLKQVSAHCRYGRQC